MSLVQPIEQVVVVPTEPPKVNDFSIKIGTVNGSGSQTSNLTLLRALFKMGIPVSGKNIFPSNIQGLPTWYTIRVSKDGFSAPREEYEIAVAMNPETFDQDLAGLVTGGAFFYGDHIDKVISREDVIAYPIPAQRLARQSGAPPQLRNYIANMAYVGVLAQMLGIELDKIRQALNYHFEGNEKPVNLNFGVVEAAADWARENLEKRDLYRVETMDATGGCILTDGNTAAGLGAIYGGVQLVSWYPITPATPLAETLIEYLPKLRKDPVTGKSTYIVLQVEDELAAIGMTIGAGWAGLRAMTTTSGPGISLMAEFAGLAYYAEVPVVIWDVQRVGPSTGLPTRTQQGDIMVTRFLGQGDTEHVLLFPGSVNECFEFGWRAFDVAERLQTPIFVLSDLDLGMNQWMGAPFEYPDQPMDRGKILWEEDLEKWVGEWGRYQDMDGDGIPYRTVMGNRHPKAAYFARGTGHDERANYSEEPEVWVRTGERLKRKFETARGLLPQPVVEVNEHAQVGIITLGSNYSAVEEARHLLAGEGIPASYLRVRAVPFARTVSEFIARHERVYVVENNRDGQLHQLLILETPGLATRLKSICRSDGLPLSAQWIADTILAQEM
ncbi:MAG: 2-oxoacid:acceptor oxidoreductase subunit alpha [Chloroflexota bacterium]